MNVRGLRVGSGGGDGHHPSARSTEQVTGQMTSMCGTDINVVTLNYRQHVDIYCAISVHVAPITVTYV